MRGRWRTVLGVVCAVAVGCTVGLAYAWWRQDTLIYHPTAAVPAPHTVGLTGAEEVTVTTDDGLDLDAWFVPAAGETVGAALVLHGNAGNRAHRAPLAAALRDLGLATLVLDYRGFGGNPGRPSQEGLLADARAAADALAQRTDLDPDRIVYIGESLGSAVAVGLAAERPAAGIVLRSPFPSLTDVGARAVPSLPVRALLRDRFPAEEWIAGYHGPTLAIVGQRDTLIPTALSSQLLAAAPGPSDTVVVDAGHNDRALLDGDEMLDAIAAFLREHAGMPVRDRGAVSTSRR